MTCPRCIKRGKTWDGDNPKCAFENIYVYFQDSTSKPYTTNQFSKDNWNCATMNDLREFIDDQIEKGGRGYYYRDDISTGTIAVLPYETDNFYGNLVMTWHKERGRTGSAMVVCDDREPQILTLDIAEEILKGR